VGAWIETMKTINIKVLNSVYCRTDSYGKLLLAPAISYKVSKWNQTKYKKVEQIKTITMITRKRFFLTGLLPRVEKYCNRKGYHLNIIKSPELKKSNLPEPNIKSFHVFTTKVKKLLGKEYRENQLQKQMEIILSAIKAGRGLLVSPTGTGKTTLALGIASCFPKLKLLYMVHTKTLVTQTAKEFKKYGFKVSEVMEGNKDQSEQIIVATRQSLINMELANYDYVMIDEAHHLSDKDGTYAKILKNIDKPKFGFTATFKETKDKVKLSIEGIIGQVVGELTMEKAQEMNILAKVKIRILKVPKQFIESRKYEDVYNEAIVDSRVFNKLVVKTTYEYFKKDKIVFIFVTRIEHGYNIQKIASSIYNIKIPYVHGGTPTKEREEIKKKLIERKLKFVIATVVWKEGLNIPTLDAIINASGGKDDLPIVQLIGRGLRLLLNKTEMDLVDFFDQSSNYLISHFGNRICLYCEKGWM